MHGSLGLWAIQVAGLDAQKDDFTSLRQRHDVHQDVVLALGITLAQVRSQNSENDRSGKLFAPPSLASASTGLNSASLPLPKLPSIP
jgi:hypothetical protein